ncbi:hypothetical protein F4054_20680 [Candidatus Poribacteria bacterium]|nr:hypothetical protein [Candidatus Poribacteria bacterium]MYG08823.1 hypothetical protein [Candidatus Poribacteria bacterium]MYK24663.1 hypothetical protein [Candidatus Poribacteria bacterium]
MTDQEFQERVLAWIERTEDWKDRTDNRLDTLEGQMDTLQERIGSLQEGIAWIRGKMEGTQESRAALWGKIAVLAAVGSAIIAVLAYFK